MRGMGIAESGLQRGETVYLSRHDSGSLCLLVKRDGLIHVVHRDDGLVRLFDGRGEVEFYCRVGGFDLSEEYARSVVREKHLLPSGMPEKSSSSEHEEPSPPLDPEWEKALVEATRRKTPEELEWLELLIADDFRWLELLGDLRPHVQAWCDSELVRRKVLGPRSCTCSRCIDRSLSPLRDVEGEITKVRLQLG